MATMIHINKYSYTGKSSNGGKTKQCYKCYCIHILRVNRFVCKDSVFFRKDKISQCFLSKKTPNYDFTKHSSKQRGRSGGSGLFCF